MIKYSQNRVDKEKAYYGLRLMVYQDQIEFVDRDKYELEHMMLVLKKDEIQNKNKNKVYVRYSMRLTCAFENFMAISIGCE